MNEKGGSMAKIAKRACGIVMAACLVAQAGGMTTNIFGQQVDSSSIGLLPPEASGATPASLWEPKSAADVVQSPADSHVDPAVTPASFQSIGRLSNRRVESDRLWGLFARSDESFSNFISPQTNPLFFEDPRTLTEVRFHFVNQWIPNGNPVFAGGDAQFLAAQIRLALTERLSIIATKDGYIWLNPGALPATNGWANVAAGLKYNIIRRPETQTVVSGGLTYEMPVGTKDVFQGQGGGDFHLFGTGGTQLFERMHLLGAGGLRQPADHNLGSTMIYSSNHIDYEFLERSYGVLELNYFHWTRSGTALPVNFEGNDLLNLGSTDVAGNSIVTLGAGLKRRFGRMNEAGIAYELPLSSRKDLLASRLYVDLIVRY